MIQGLNQGPWTYVVAASDIAANTLVALDTAGKLVVNGATGKPIGTVQEAFKAGATATVYPLIGRVRLTSSAAIAVGDLVKVAASGKAAPEGTVTTATVNTIGQAEEAAGAGDVVIVVNCG